MRRSSMRAYLNRTRHAFRQSAAGRSSPRLLVVLTGVHAAWQPVLMLGRNAAENCGESVLLWWRRKLWTVSDPPRVGVGENLVQGKIDRGFGSKRLTCVLLCVSRA